MKKQAFLLYLKDKENKQLVIYIFICNGENLLAKFKDFKEYYKSINLDLYAISGVETQKKAYEAATQLNNQFDNENRLINILEVYEKNIKNKKNDE